MQWIIWLAIISLTAGWLILSLLLFIFQSSLIYFPDKVVHSTPAAWGLSHEDVTLVTTDGTTLHGWWLPHPYPRASLLFLHGNGGNIAYRLQKLQLFHQLGLSILIIDYQGYGRSEGNPDEQGTYLNARAAWDFLIQKKGTATEKIIIYGESLGGAIAAWLTNQVQAGALIVESSFTSIRDMGKYYYPFLPVDTITRIHYPTRDYLQTVTQPVLIIHSPTDEIVPYQMGRQLFELANPPKTFLEIQGTHNEGFLQSGAIYTDGLNRFIGQYFKREATSIEFP
ncbi:MAG: alpha/beta hydrolase [Nitrosomonas sp.]|nr:alpha/beta hydrolase [Nitrosomonas sp.]